MAVSAHDSVAKVVRLRQGRFVRFDEIFFLAQETEITFFELLYGMEVKINLTKFLFINISKRNNSRQFIIFTTLT